MTQLHLPRLRLVFDGQAAPYGTPGGAAVTMPRAREATADEAAQLRRRIALTSVILAFLLGAAAVGVAAGWLPEI